MIDLIHAFISVYRT